MSVWSETEVAMLRQLYPDLTIPVKEVAAQIGRTPAALKVKAHAVGVYRSQRFVAMKSRTKTTRPCLCCGEPFKSEGIHNRLCRECKE